MYKDHKPVDRVAGFVGVVITNPYPYPYPLPVRVHKRTPDYR